MTTGVWSTVSAVGPTPMLFSSYVRTTRGQQQQWCNFYYDGRGRGSGTGARRQQQQCHGGRGLRGRQQQRYDVQPDIGAIQHCHRGRRSPSLVGRNGDDEDGADRWWHSLWRGRPGTAEPGTAELSLPLSFLFLYLFNGFVRALRFVWLLL